MWFCSQEEGGGGGGASARLLGQVGWQICQNKVEDEKPHSVKLLTVDLTLVCKSRTVTDPGVFWNIWSG